MRTVITVTAVPHQGRCAARSNPKARNPSGLGKHLCMPPAQGFGHLTFTIGPTAVEKKPQADCRPRKTSNAPGPLSGPFCCSPKRELGFVIF